MVTLPTHYTHFVPITIQYFKGSFMFEYETWNVCTFEHKGIC